MTKLETIADQLLDIGIKRFGKRPLSAMRAAMLVDLYRRKIGLRRRRWPWPTPVSRLARLSPEELLFLKMYCSLIAKMSQVDGKVSTKEIETLDSFIRTELRLNSHQKLVALKMFGEAKQAKHSFEYYAKQYNKMAAGSTVLKRNMLDCLFALTAVDGNRCFREERLIDAALTIFCFTREDLSQLQARYDEIDRLKRRLKTLEQELDLLRDAAAGTTADRVTVVEADRHYEVLGCLRTDSLAAIKKRYRVLVRECHPDTFSGQEVPAEFLDVQKNRFREIQAAYEWIREERGQA